MAFVSFTYDSYDEKSDQYFYTLVDSEFGSVEVEVGVGVGVGVVREYGKRGLPVGRNLALAVLWLHKTYPHYSIKQRIEWQDTYCPKYVDNWAMYAKERDFHLERLLALL